MPAFSRSLLAALLLAACGLVQAQAPAPPGSGTDARSASPSSPNMTPPRAGTDTQATQPTAAECARLRAEQPGLNSGGLNADMKAKLDQCQQSRTRGAAPR